MVHRFLSRPTSRRRCGRGGEEGGYVSSEICCFLTSRGWRWREARWTPGMRVLDRGRYVARAHLCAALTRTVADSFLPLRRVDAVAAISPALFLVNTFRELFASPLRGRAPVHAGPPSLSRARGLSRAPKTGPRPSPLGRPARLRRASPASPLLKRVYSRLHASEYSDDVETKFRSTDRCQNGQGEGEIRRPRTSPEAAGAVTRERARSRRVRRPSPRLPFTRIAR